MRSCPHCQFLVVDGAENCSVCKQPLTVPEQPPGPWGAPVPPLPGSPEAEASEAASRPAPARRGPNAGLIVGAVLGVLVLLTVLGVGALSFLGSRVEQAIADSPPPDTWTPYVDPSGRYRVELPGAPVVTDEEEAVGVGEPLKIQVAEVARPGWDSFVAAYDLPEEIVGTRLPPEALRDGMLAGMRADRSVGDLAVTTSTTESTPAGPALDTWMSLTVDGVESVGMIRIIEVDRDVFAMVTIGPSVQGAEVTDLHDRVTSTFSAPPTA